MTARSAASRIALGLRAQKGGSVVVVVALAKGEPRVVHAGFLPTAAEGDRLAFEPYHVAAAMPRGPNNGASAEAKAAVAEARKRQSALALAGLGDIIRTLKKAGHEQTVAALLINRAGWMDDLLSYSLAWPDHPPVAEGLAVRDALRFALTRLEIAATETDEKSLPDVASAALGLKPSELEARLKLLGAAVKPWRKEQKLACLAAWLALAGRKR